MIPVHFASTRRAVPRPGVPPLVKDEHSDKQKNAIALLSHRAVHCQGGASRSGRVRLGFMGTKRSRDFSVCTLQGRRFAAWALKNV